jgi:hypothetical protein
VEVQEAGTGGDYASGRSPLTAHTSQSGRMKPAMRAALPHHRRPVPYRVRREQPGADEPDHRAQHPRQPAHPRAAIRRAFAERLATGDSAPETARTSLIVATDALLRELLRPPPPGASPDQLRMHAINEAVWLLLGHLVCTNDPLGSRKQ